jgi:hypothetical protein
LALICIALLIAPAIPDVGTSSVVRFAARTLTSADVGPVNRDHTQAGRKRTTDSLTVSVHRFELDSLGPMAFGDWDGSTTD